MNSNGPQWDASSVRLRAVGDDAAQVREGAVVAAGAGSGSTSCSR